MMHRRVSIELDLNRDRLREIVSEALRMIWEYNVGDEYTRTKEEITDEFEKIISSDRVSVQFYLRVGSKKFPDLTLRVDPRKRKVLCISKNKSRIAEINYFMRIL